MKLSTQYKLVFFLALLSILSIIWSFFISRTSAFELSPHFSEGDTYMKVRHLGTLDLQSLVVDGITVGKLSDLAWEADSNTLYAISDNGYLFRFRIDMHKGFLSSVHPLSAVPLLSKQGKPLASLTKSDAEGLALLNANNQQKNDTVLLVSFEGHTRVEAYSSSGQWRFTLPLPGKLERPENYYKRNTSLESILVHPSYGIIVATELFMEKEARQRRVLYAISPELGEMRWQFPSLPYAESGVTSIDIAEDGSIIILERSWPSPLQPIVIGLRRIRLESCKKYLPCPVEDLAIFDSRKGWKMDNYEGLAHFRNNQFFMVSDDNIGILQRTLLTMIEIKI